MAHTSEARRRAEREGAELKHRTGFAARLDKVPGNREAVAITDATPPQTAPWRRFHSNLKFFLEAFNRPFGASSAEIELYRRLSARMDAAGQLKPGVRQRVDADLGPKPN